MNYRKSIQNDNSKFNQPYSFRYQFIAKLLYLCFKKIIKVEEPLYSLKISQPVIFAYNHNNYFETIVLGSYLINRWPKRRLSFIVDWMYGHLPVIGWLLRSFQPIYVYRKRARWDFLNRRKETPARQSLQECLACLAQGGSLGIFPEGTRNPDPLVLKRGRRGIGEIALRSEVPVVPVGIDFPAGKRCGRIPACGRIILRFGSPLHFTAEISAWRRAQQYIALSPKAQEKFRVFLCRRITHTIMQELARLSGKHYPYRQPEGFGAMANFSSYLLNRGE